MRMLQLTLHDGQGGMETLAAALDSRLPQLGIQVETVALDSGSGRPTPVGRMTRLAGAIKATSPQIILAHSTIPNAYARVVKRGTPVVTVLHSASDEWLDPKVRAAERILSRRTIQVVTVSDFKRQEYVAHFPRMRTRVVVIPNGVALRTVTPRGNSESFRLLYAARINPQKDLETLIRATAMLQDSGMKFELKVAGTPEDAAYWSRISAMIAADGLREVTILGPRDDVPELMAQADLLVHPSRAEAHSLTLMEAAVYGLPSIVTDDVKKTLDGRAVALSFRSGSASDLAKTILHARQILPKLHLRASRAAEELRDAYSMESVSERYSRLLRASLARHVASQS
jgi:L-malate glycosyltransferase